MAICYFGKVNFCDVVLFETGLGGRFDSTNVIHPVLTIITNIGHDHMHILGNTLGEIAYEKAELLSLVFPLLLVCKMRKRCKSFKSCKGKSGKLIRDGQPFYSVT